MASQEKISVHSLADLKNTSDDAIPAYLNSLSFKQSHVFSDTRLALGYSAFAICAATFYWDYKLGFESTKLYTTIAVGIYTLLNSILTFWIWGVEKGTVYVGTNSRGDKISVATKTTKHVPVYNVTVTVTEKGGSSKVVSIKREFREWFDGQGRFVARPFQEMLSANVRVVEEAQREKRVKSAGRLGKEKKPAVEVEENWEDKERRMDEKWAALLKESSGDGTGEAEGMSSGAATPSGKSAKKRGKRA